jgi:hypothetical protein
MSKKAHKISKNIPRESPLYSYLATKEETGDPVGMAVASVQGRLFRNIFRYFMSLFGHYNSSKPEIQ